MSRHRRARHSRVAALGIVAVTVAAASCATDLGTLGGEFSVPQAVSPLGFVVGGSRAPATPPAAYGPGQGFLWDPGTRTMTGLTATGSSSTDARDVLDLNPGDARPAGSLPALVAGVASFPDGHTEAVVWGTTGATASSMHPAGYNSSRLEGWAPNRYAVGAASYLGLGFGFTGGTYRDNIRVAVWDSDLGFHDLGATTGLQAMSSGLDINRDLVVVGQTWAGYDELEHGYVLPYGKQIAHRLGAPDGSNRPTFAAAVNDHGQVVGSWSEAGGARRPLLWTYTGTGVSAASTTALPAGATGGRLVDVSNERFAVGNATYAGAPARGYCVSLTTGMVVDLGPDTTAHAIADSGTVAVSRPNGLGFPVAATLPADTCKH